MLSFCYPSPPFRDPRVFFILLISTGAYSPDTNVAPSHCCFCPSPLSLAFFSSSRWKHGLMRLHILYRSSPSGRHLAYCCRVLQVSFYEIITLVYHRDLWPTLFSAVSLLPSHFRFFGPGKLKQVCWWNTGCVGLLYHLAPLLTELASYYFSLPSVLPFLFTPSSYPECVGYHPSENTVGMYVCWRL